MVKKNSLTHTPSWFWSINAAAIFQDVPVPTLDLNELCLTHDCQTITSARSFVGLRFCGIQADSRGSNDVICTLHFPLLCLS